MKALHKIVACMTLLLILTGCGGSNSGSGQAPAAPLQAANVDPHQLGQFLQGEGNNITSFDQILREVSGGGGNGIGSELSFALISYDPQITQPSTPDFQVSAPAPVPEPSTLLLFGAGLVGLVGWRWRRK